MTRSLRSIRLVLCWSAVAAALLAADSTRAGDESPAARRPGAATKLRERTIRFDRRPRRTPRVARADEARRLDVAALLAAEFAAAQDGGLRAKAAGPRAGVRPRSAPLRRSVVAANGETMEVARASGAAAPRQVRSARRSAAGAVRDTSVRIPAADRDAATARAFLRASRELLRLRDPDAEMRVEDVESDDLGCRQVRFAQTWQGLDVWPAGLIVQVRGDAIVDALSGAFVPTPSRVVTRPTVDAAFATALSRDAVPGGADATVPPPTLVLHAGKGAAPRLAWRVEVAVSEASRWLVVVDAHTGAVLRRFDQVAQEDVSGSGRDLLGTTRPLRVFRQGATFFMVDTSKPMFDPTSSPPDPFATRGGLVIVDARSGGPEPPISAVHVTSANQFSWALADAVSASFGLSQTYDYYLERHGRNSLDGRGGTILAVVRVGNGLANAFWNGQYMAFGDAEPYAASIDVVGHELTHGVTEKTAALVYMDQSGALNEAFSDIFGEMVEARTTGGGHDWKVGTELSAPIRDLRNPGSIEILPGLPYPSRMSQFIETTEDNGGVHLNSSIINRAYYLLAEGLPDAVGVADAERIFYRTLTTKLVAQSRFPDCRLGAVASAEELFGAASAQARATAAAFDAVEILDLTPTPEPAPAPSIDGPDATLFLYFDTDAGALVLGRRETALGDGAQGVALTTGVGESRPSVRGDGAVAAVVSAERDVCLADTLGAEAKECAGAAGLVHSVAISRDGARFAFVLRDELGNPDNAITVVDSSDGSLRTFTLSAPLLDGGTAEVVAADAMAFSRDGGFLVYDAFNSLSMEDGARLGLWSIYGLDLASESVFSIVDPTPGLDIGSPALAHTTDRWLAFEAIDPADGTSTVLTRDLYSGEFGVVAEVANATVLTTPCFTGDDAAIIYAVPAGTNTGASLLRQALAEDHLNAQGDATTWLSDAAYGVVYRRGDLPEPPPPAEVELTLRTGVPRVESVSIDVPVGAATVPVRLALAHTTSGAFTADGTCTVGTTPVTVRGKLLFRAATRTWLYDLSLRSTSPAIRGSVRGAADGTTARVTLRTPEGRANVVAAADVTAFEPTSRITLRSQADVRGRVRGTATVLAGFGNDASTTALVTGTVKLGSLQLVVRDPAAKRRLKFKGARAGASFVGRLSFRLPPAVGIAPGFAIPDGF